METVNDMLKGKQKPLRGIVCDVENCAYHQGECNCTAPQITVGPSFAACCSDTVCATFKEKQN